MTVPLEIQLTPISIFSFALYLDLKVAINIPAILVTTPTKIIRKQKPTSDPEIVLNTIPAPTVPKRIG